MNDSHKNKTKQKKSEYDTDQRLRQMSAVNSNPEIHGETSGKAALGTLHEILTDRERRSLRDQGRYWGKITADINSFSDLLKGTWELCKQSSTKPKGVFKILSAVGETGRCCEPLTNETEIFLRCM